MSLKTALQNYRNIDLNSMRPAGFLDKEASQIETTVCNVNRGHGWIPNLNCPACGSERSEIIMTRFGRNVLQCRACEIGYMEGFPVDLGDVYNHEGYNNTQRRITCTMWITASSVSCSSGSTSSGAISRSPPFPRAFST
jgi:hypothetical protein